MVRLFVGWALVAVLASALALGWPRLGPAALLLAASVHVLAWVALGSMARSVRASVGARGLPGWWSSQAEKHLRKVRPAQLGALALLAASGWARRSHPGQGWALGLSAASLGFQLGAFAGELAALVAQGRLVHRIGLMSAQGRRPGERIGT